MKQYKTTGQINTRQQGATLIEAMVSIFVLSFGVLVLMLAQLGSVSSVIDADNQSEVARAADNYAETLAAAPILTVVEEDKPTGNKKYLTQAYAPKADCRSALGATLNNASISACTSDANGHIQIKWNAQDSKDTEGFTYNLSAGNTAP